MGQGLVGAVLGTVGKILLGWTERKSKEVEAKMEIAKVRAQGRVRVEVAQAEAKVKLAEKELDHRIQWELLALESAKKSWKDEWWTLIIGGPLVALLFPQTQPYVIAWFRVLQTRCRTGISLFSA